MTSNESINNSGGVNKQPVSGTPGKTINLQGVAAFVGLVELLAQELGTTAGRIQGVLPNGPATFEELVGEIVFNNQGFSRSLTLMTKPGSPLEMLFRSAWHNGNVQDVATATASGVTSHFCLSATVEQVLPQGRALARYCEDAFSLLDSMVTLGQSSKLSSMSVSDSELQAFEHTQAATLVTSFAPKKAPVLDS